MRKTKRVDIKITVDIPEDHDEGQLVKYIVGGFPADKNLSDVRIFGWDAQEFPTQEGRYRNRLDMTMIALGHAVSRYEMSDRARSWLKAEMANIRKVLGRTKETR